jgi:hypothetical protein
MEEKAAHMTTKGTILPIRKTAVPTASTSMIFCTSAVPVIEAVSPRPEKMRTGPTRMMLR